jgi:Uma2 family endonuclease
VQFGPQGLVPDLAGWRRERLPALLETARFELAPDWVCEVLSPSTACIDRVDKLPIYAGAGVRHAWLIDPDLRTLEAFENQAGRWLVLAARENDNPVQLPPFDAISFPLDALWAD